MNARALLDRAEDAVFSLLLPYTKCVLCASTEDICQGICAQCMEELASLRLSPAGCPVCGLPGEGLCASCLDAPSAFTRARGAYRYKGVVRSLVHVSKFAGQPRVAARAFAPAMAECLREIMPDADCLVPVPLSKKKMLERGYNQSAFLSARLRALTGIPVREGFLYRNRDTAQQAGLDRDARIYNVKDAFTAKKAAKNLRVVLIDDVITTRNTASACASALIRAGALDVCVVAAARAPERRS